MIVGKNPEIMKPYIINGLNKEEINNLKKFARNKECPNCNIIEVMCCKGGCIGGNATINPESNSKKNIEELLKDSKDL